MGLGSFGLGTTPFGADRVYIPPALPAVLTPRALYYDPSTKQFLLYDALGNAIDVHPVDQIVALRLTTTQGQSASDTTLGTRLALLTQGLSTARATQVATQEVTSVVQDLLDNGDILLVSVVADMSVYGRASFAVTYVNLRLPQTSRRYPTVATITGGGGVGV